VNEKCIEEAVVSQPDSIVGHSSPPVRQVRVPREQFSLSDSAGSPEFRVPCVARIQTINQSDTSTSHPSHSEESGALLSETRQSVRSVTPKRFVSVHLSGFVYSETDCSCTCLAPHIISL